MKRVGAEERAAAASLAIAVPRIVPFSCRSIFTIDYRAVPSGAVLRAQQAAPGGMGIAASRMTAVARTMGHPAPP